MGLAMVKGILFRVALDDFQNHGNFLLVSVFDHLKKMVSPPEVLNALVLVFELLQEKKQNWRLNKTQ